MRCRSVMIIPLRQAGQRLWAALTGFRWQGILRESFSAIADRVGFRAALKPKALDEEWTAELNRRLEQAVNQLDKGLLGNPPPRARTLTIATILIPRFWMRNTSCPDRTTIRPAEVTKAHISTFQQNSDD